jgi:hypothetical protein
MSLLASLLSSEFLGLDSVSTEGVQSHRSKTRRVLLSKPIFVTLMDDCKSRRDCGSWKTNRLVSRNLLCLSRLTDQSSLQESRVSPRSFCSSSISSLICCLFLLTKNVVLELLFYCPSVLECRWCWLCLSVAKSWLRSLWMYVWFSSNFRLLFPSMHRRKDALTKRCLAHQCHGVSELIFFIFIHLLGKITVF